LDSQAIATQPVEEQMENGRHPPFLRHHFANLEQQKETSTCGIWLFLLAEIMLFGGLFCAYLIYRNWYYPTFVAG
jgi:cytochrome c oxidase subunit 3